MEKTKEVQLKNPLVWIDCEMTGLNPAVDELVEIAVVVTDADLNIVGPGLDLLIKPTPEALAQMSDFVRNLHTESGLLDELADGIPLEDAERLTLEYIKEYVPESGTALLAGNSVGQDSLFLRAYMPSVSEHLHYRIIDVSTIKELTKRWYHRVYVCGPQKHGGHRALADILESIQELEYYKRALFPVDLNPEHGYYTQIALDVTESAHSD